MAWESGAPLLAMPHNPPSPSLSCFRFPFLFLFLAGPIGVPAFGQSNVRPVPVVGRAPATDGEHLDSRKAEEASYLVLGGSPSALDAGQTVEPEWLVALDLQGTFLPSADLENGGERALQRGGWNATLTRDSGDRSATFYLDAEASFYDWSGSVPLVAGTTDPFNDLYLTRVGALASFEEDAALGWFTGMEITFSGEDDASIMEALSVGAVTGVRCRASEDLTLNVGLAVLTRLDDSAWLIPYLGFDLRLSPRVRLATEGAKLLFEAELSPDWTATLAAQYEFRQFRLNDGGALEGGAFQDDEIRATAELSWRFGAQAALSLEGGLVVWQESTFIPGDGAHEVEVESDPAPFAAVTLHFGS